MLAPTLSTASPSSAPPAKRLRVQLLVFIAIVAGAGAASFVIQPPAIVAEPGVVMQLPEQVMGFKGQKEEVSESERVLLPQDTQLEKKRYLDANGERVDAQIVLSGAEHRSIHRPEMCLRGQGWEVRVGKTISIPMKSGDPLKAMALTITRPVLIGDEKHELKSLYLYWFVSKESITAHHHERIMRTNLDLLLHNRSNRWAYVIFSAPILEGLQPGGKNEEQTLELLKNFVAECAPSFMKREGAAEPSES